MTLIDPPLNPPSSEHPDHPWLARVIIGITMLILSFVGVVITNISALHAWAYWRAIPPLFGLMCLWLSWYLRRRRETVSPITIGHEILHWVGLNVAVFLVVAFVNMGLISRLIASFQILTLLSLTIYLAGIYIEVTFVPLGILLGLFALTMAYIQTYLYLLLIPVVIITAAIIYWLAKRKKPKYYGQ